MYVQAAYICLHVMYVSVCVFSCRATRTLYGTWHNGPVQLLLRQVRNMAYRIQPSTDQACTTVILFTPSCSRSRCNSQTQAKRPEDRIIDFCHGRCRGHAPDVFIIIFTCGACQCTVTTRNYHRAPSRRRRLRRQRVKSASAAAAAYTYVHMRICMCMYMDMLECAHAFGWFTCLARLKWFHFCFGSCQHYR